MRDVVARAVEERARAGIPAGEIAAESDVDALVAAAGLGLRTDRRYADGLFGRYFRHTVCVKFDLEPGERLVTKAHEFGHACLGHEEGVYLLVPCAAPRTPCEIAATVFTFALLVGEPADTQEGLDEQLHRAEAAGVPLRFLDIATTLLAPALPAGLLPAQAQGVGAEDLRRQLHQRDTPAGGIGDERLVGAA